MQNTFTYKISVKFVASLIASTVLLDWNSVCIGDVEITNERIVIIGGKKNSKNVKKIPIGIP